MTAPAEGPCAPWLTWDEVSDYCTPAEIPEGLQTAVLLAASRTMWTRTCKQYGVCSTTARVLACCRHAYAWRSSGGYWLRPGWGGCGCGSYPYVDLGTDPVVAVQSVTIDGTVLDADAYRVDEWRRLVRTDGDTWPGGSDPLADVGGDRTFEIEWTHGVPVPDDGKAMAALLACKLAGDVAEQCGSGPGNRTQVAAEGITIQINPPEGDTGVPFVEAWLANYHCGGGGIFDPGAARQQLLRVDT